MAPQPTTSQPAISISALPPRRAYAAPRLTIHGSVQGLTNGVGDINGVSGFPDGE